MPSQRPVLSDTLESSRPGIYVAGDLAGAPLVKLAMEQGYRAAHTAAADGARKVVVIGAGCAGLNAAIELRELGVDCVVLEKGNAGQTIAELPDGKIIYAEPHSYSAPGELWIDEASNAEVTARWREDVERFGIDLREGQTVTRIDGKRGNFTVQTEAASFDADRVILTIGKHGNPRRLQVPGEDLPMVSHRLYNPNHYRDERILVVGGGNAAAEAAIALSGRNAVTLAYRGKELHRLTRENRRKLQASGVEVLYGSEVRAFAPGSWVGKEGRVRETDRCFVLIGSELPARFLRGAGIRLDNDWTPKRYLWLLLTFALAYTIYGVKQSAGHEFWPFTGWGAEAFTFFARPWSFWYTVLYTGLMTIFGIRAMKRWGFDRQDRFQIWRYVSLIGFQWVFFFLIPEFLFRWAVEYRWVGERLASDPSFAGDAWRSYGLVYAWPLFFYTFFGDPNRFWIVWGCLLSFGLIPVLALFHGKRYCSWICGCGGLAETVGDRWRHLAPKGEAAIRWEKMNAWILGGAIVVTLSVLAGDAIAAVRKPAASGLAIYHLLADVWLVGIIPVALYPFLGGKIWCRYWCPLAKMMEIFSALFTRFRVSRFSIASNDRCIACGECTRNCQVGIDVMRFALKQETITNANSSCIGCGICVTVCPMKVLSFESPAVRQELVQITAAGSVPKTGLRH